MALKLKISRTGINNLGTEMYLSDVTGNYISESNEGGWGVPNPERGLKALIAQAILHTSQGDVDVAMVDYNPESVEHFTLLPTTDGYIEFIMVAVDKFLPTIIDKYGWTLQSGLVKLTESGIVSVKPTDLFKDPLFLDAVSFKTVLLARCAIYRNRQNLELIRVRKAANEDRSHNREIADKEKHFNTVRGLVEGARYQWCMENYTEAQTIVETFNNLISQ
jgi:hypothetical protein